MIKDQILNEHSINVTKNVPCELRALFCCTASLTGGLSVVLLELLSDVSISFILHACLQQFTVPTDTSYESPRLAHDIIKLNSELSNWRKTHLSWIWNDSLSPGIKGQ